MNTYKRGIQCLELQACDGRKDDIRIFCLVLKNVMWVWAIIDAGCKGCLARCEAEVIDVG